MGITPGGKKYPSLPFFFVFIFLYFSDVFFPRFISLCFSGENVQFLFFLLIFFSFLGSRVCWSFFFVWGVGGEKRRVFCIFIRCCVKSFSFSIHVYNGSKTPRALHMYALEGAPWKVPMSISIVSSTRCKFATSILKDFFRNGVFPFFLKEKTLRSLLIEAEKIAELFQR